MGKQNLQDLTKKVFGRLTAIERIEDENGSLNKWLCECSCGEITKVSIGNLNNGHTKSCGCLQKDTPNRKKGINSPKYNPEITDEERLKARYILGKSNKDKFRNEVFKRDKFTCQKCFEHGNRLNAHHLDGWNWCKEKRFDTSNGVTLCEGCHKKFHDVYGYGDNKRHQFYDFVKVKDDIANYIDVQYGEAKEMH